MTTEAHLLIPGSQCEVRSLGKDGKIAQRLAQMGVVPGSRLEIVRCSPLGETLEVASREGERFALRRHEMAALDCRLVAAPLSSPAILDGHSYRILSLDGGRTFRQRMREHGLQPGDRVHVGPRSPHRLTVSRPTTGAELQLGHGEAEKIIVRLPPEDGPP